ncbi:MAG: 2-oxoglutarate ferredoxin oxidoreductase subunit alpha [Anaerolineae bacterium SM23_ 63]|nr:MAG: 2-oxoglutarate ferredoxin oxidoreductase subunit alpha [Anaerolineae bacterium SM23_ 63]HEY47323.1 2-oxoacid:acceptor oxidoreductase subunit alpha [Anaerolineae bacterium]
MTSSGVLTGKHFFQGDEACAEGAIAAGCRFFGGYPITPSTEIAERLAHRFPEIGGVFIQMEDEMGSMAAILGASAAGARAMTATSGPGFSLMMENIGLGVMMELPCVVVNVQRGSPSTGLPTLPGQSDVMQARWGTHGDYALAAFSPWSPQEMFDLTIHAFNVADRYRVPVLLMADEVVGHMVERVVIPPEDQIPRWERKRPDPKKKDSFEPFLAEDPDLVPPLAHAGEGYRVHFTGLTHDEQGYPDMDAETHHRLVTRLVEKINHNAENIVRTEDHFMDDARIVVIAYGSTARSARRAVKDARQEGIPAGFLRLVSLWPFPAEQIKKLADQADSFIVAEMNLGQMALEVERHIRRPVTGVYHAGGVMMAPDRILKAIREVATRDDTHQR